MQKLIIEFKLDELELSVGDRVKVISDIMPVIKDLPVEDIYFERLNKTVYREGVRSGN